MKTVSIVALFLGAFTFACGGSSKDAEMPSTGQEAEESAVTPPKNPAPPFTLSDAEGKSYSLKDYAGKIVVVEWFNPGCPFVKYAYGKGPLASMARDYSQKDVIWLTVNSGAEGKQGALVADNTAAAKTWNMSAPILFDKTGDVGKSYGAKTTPHIWVIDRTGDIVYQGALDNAPMGEAQGTYQNYVRDALDAVLAGKPVKLSETTPYGCSVKYGS
jgi:hypothetical protein